MTGSHKATDHSVAGDSHTDQYSGRSRRAFPEQGAEYAQFTDQIHSGMNTMMQDMHAEPPSGNADVDFLAMMIPHHAGAVDMARLVLQYGHDPIVREIAEKILTGQISEIEGMRGRLAVLRQPEAEYPSLSGNRGD